MKTYKILIISALILGFVFGFDDKRPVFELSSWLLNYLKATIFSFIALTIFLYTPNLFKEKYGCKIGYEIWNLKRFGIKPWRTFAKKSRIGSINVRIKSIPIGIIIPILITLLSKGSLYFVATLSMLTTIKPAYRIGKKSVIQEFENAKIALIGPLTMILLAVLIQTIFPQLHDFTLISSMIAISYMLPLPGLNGATIFFSSKPLYTLSAVFIIITALLLNFISPILATIIATIFAITLALIYLKGIYS